MPYSDETVVAQDYKTNIRTIKMAEGHITFNIIEPNLPKDVYEAEARCREWTKEGWFCGIIYCYTHYLTNKSYYGQTTRPLKRHQQHISGSRKTKPDVLFDKILGRKGIENFDYSVVDIIRDKNEQRMHELLDTSERHFIKHHRSSVRLHGYNVAKGGWRTTPSVGKAKSVDMFDLEGNFIKTYPTISAANYEHGFSGPTIRQACNHIHHTAGGYLWAWHGKQPVLPPTKRYVYAYDDNGYYIRQYDSAFAATKALGKKQGTIDNALKDKYRLASNMYWRTYKTDRIAPTDFPNLICAYDLDGNFVKWFPCLSKAKEFTNEAASSSISHAIIRKTAHRGYLWRTEYCDKIDPTDGRFVNKVGVIAIFPDGRTQEFSMIKEAAEVLGIDKSSIQRCITRGNKTKGGFQFKRLK